MKKETKEQVVKVVNGIYKDYFNAMPDEKRVIFNDLVKGINLIKEIESQDLDNQIKKKRMKLDLEKFELEKKRSELEEEKIRLDQIKIDHDRKKTLSEEQLANEKIKFEHTKLDFEKSKFNIEGTRSKSILKMNIFAKALEIGIPAGLSTWLFLLSLKAIYKDDMRIPSETWNFVKGVFKR